jgi:hypothetical protein
MFRAEHYPPFSLCADGTPAGSEPLELFGAKTSCILRFERLTAREPLDIVTARRNASRNPIDPIIRILVDRL